jgi:glycosyltransferase involved in cell wall biosynthesis
VQDRPGPRFSLIIPAHDEQELLPRLLDTVDEARRRFRRGPEQVEVIVADNASTDRTAGIAAERGCVVVEVERRRIAAARNGGAAAARGRVLGFADADMRIHPQTFNDIEDELATGRVIAGASGVRLERWSLGIAATYLVIIPWVIMLRMDTGVVFCRRDDFDRIGGYNELRHFGEDVEFLWQLKKLGRSRGQRLTRLRRAKAISSTRKFDQYGDWHYFTMLFRMLPMMLRRPEAFTEAVRQYWYGGDPG